MMKKTGGRKSRWTVPLSLGTAFILEFNIFKKLNPYAKYVSLMNQLLWTLKDSMKKKTIAINWIQMCYIRFEILKIF